jgi:hypothetical protein
MATKPYVPIQVKANKALIYVYRPESFVSRGLHWSFIINGEKTYSPLINNGYIPVYVEPGTINIELKQNDTLIKSHLASLTLTVKKGKTYYVKATPHPFYKYDFVLMNENVAKKEIKKALYFIPEN